MSLKGDYIGVEKKKRDALYPEGQFCVFVFLVCVPVYTFECVHAFVHACVSGGLKLMPNVFLDLSPPYFLKQDFLLSSMLSNAG